LRHQGKYVFAYLEPVMPEINPRQAYIGGRAHDVADDAGAAPTTAEKLD
jgi:hypothetical protein